MKAKTGYVVYVAEHLRDGIEEFAKCFDTQEAALAWINKGRFAQDNHRFRLFELGKEIPLQQETVSLPQPAIVKKGWKLK